MGHRGKKLGVTMLLCLQLLLAALPLRAADVTVEQQFTTLASDLDVDVQGVLGDVEGLPRRLLALRSYLRMSDTLRTRWTWNDAEIAVFQRSARYQRMLGDAQRVTREFEALNPGLSLYINTETRSAGVQLERWNKNRTVGTLADELLSAVRNRSPTDAAQLRQFLIDWQPSRAIPLAAPGLSLHGRGQALDFQIRKGDRIIAGTETASVASVWDAQGWTNRLQQAIQRAKVPFRGPLEQPHEPWHYEYVLE